MVNGTAGRKVSVFSVLPSAPFLPPLPSLPTYNRQRMKPVQVGDIAIGGGRPLALIAGPCVIESEPHAQSIAATLADITRRLNVPFIF